jgi:hypothetical protein
MKKLLFTLALTALATLGKATTYYVSGTGDDTKNGSTISEAWKTLDKVSNYNFSAGDIILLQGGVSFDGSIIKTNASDLTFSSYGTGKATISSGLQGGFWLENCGGITIKNLIVKGSGYKTVSMWLQGIDFYINTTATKSYDNNVIDNVEVLGYGGFGIRYATDSDLYGFSHAKVTNSLMHDNGMGGMQVTGSWDDIKGLIRMINTDVYVANCKAYYNHGRMDYKSNWSGSGILVAGTINGLVEYCEAYENGKENGSTAGGPVGIWMDDSKYVNIQYCISHHNKGGSTKRDGGGFDIDGGCYGSVIQNCDSYENEGAGYGLFQWSTGNKWSNDTVRNNTSTNDGRNTLYGAFSFWGESSNYKVTNAEVYGNRVTLDKTGYVLTFFGNNFSNIQVHDNAFCITPPGAIYSTLSTNVTLTNNSFPCMVLSIRTGSFNVKRIS